MISFKIGIRCESIPDIADSVDEVLRTVYQKAPSRVLCGEDGRISIGMQTDSKVAPKLEAEVIGVIASEDFIARLHDLNEQKNPPTGGWRSQSNVRCDSSNCQINRQGRQHGICRRKPNGCTRESNVHGRKH